MVTLFAAHTSKTNNNGENLNTEGFVQPSEKIKIHSTYVEDELDQLIIAQKLDDTDTILFSDVNIEDLSEEDIVQY